MPEKIEPLPRLLEEEIAGWALYTDGAGPSAGHPHAGWGVAIWESAAKSHLPDFELFGPVPLDPRDKRWLGASVATNNTGELTAMVEALLWLEQEAPGAPDLPAIIWFDSTYAHDVLTGTPTPTANQELIDEGQRVLERVKTKRLICWAKVRGHSGNLGNDYADHLAEQGATGKQTRHSARWLLPTSPHRFLALRSGLFGCFACTPTGRPRSIL